MIWHDGSGDKDMKFVINNSDFDASTPTLLGRYHHDHQFYILNSVMGSNILNRDIMYAYSDKVLDPCELGQRIYYRSNVRQGGQSGWLDDNLDKAPDPKEFWSLTALSTFEKKWDPESRLRDVWRLIAY